MPGNVERIVELGFADGGQGSGFLATDRHVFTASHISQDAMRLGASCRVRRLCDSSLINRTAATINGTVTWVNVSLDLTVIRLNEAVTITEKPVVCGEVDDTRPVNFFFTGFPKAADKDSRTVSGILTYVPTGPRFDLDYHSASPLNEEQWGGVSGAMVFNGDNAVGIVRTVSRVWNKKFTATPLTLLLRDPHFQHYWTTEQQPEIGIINAVTAGRKNYIGDERDMSRLLAWCNHTSEYRTLRRLTAPNGATAKSQLGLRLFGLAGHHDHRAFQIIPRLIDELREQGRNVIHIPLLRHPDFDSIDELVTEVVDNLFEGDVLASNNTTNAMVSSAIKERWDACIVSSTLDCVTLGPKVTRQRLAVAAAWLDSLTDFPCPVVIIFILRWGNQAKPGLLLRLFGNSKDPLWHVQQSWRELEQQRGIGAKPDVSSLYVLDGYEPEDLWRWIELKNVKSNLNGCVEKIAADIDNWFGGRPRMSFAELHTILSRL